MIGALYTKNKFDMFRQATACIVCRHYRPYVSGRPFRTGAPLEGGLGGINIISLRAPGGPLMWGPRKISPSFVLWNVRGPCLTCLKYPDYFRNSALWGVAEVHRLKIVPDLDVSVALGRLRPTIY